jgi:hypothetical protein
MKLPMPKQKAKKANGDVDMNLNTFLNSEPDGAERLGNSFSGNLGKEFPVSTELEVQSAQEPF